MSGPTSPSPGDLDTEPLIGPAITPVDRAAALAPDPDSSEMLRELVTSTSAGFFLRSIDPPEFLYVNAGLRNILGVGDGEPDPTVADVVAAMHPDDLAEIVAENEFGSRRAELRLRRGDGEYRWVRVSSNPVPNEGAPAVRLVGTIEDVHERKEAERALAASEERFRHLAENVPIGFVLLDVVPEPAYTYTNRAYLDVVGLDAAAPLRELGQLVAALIHPDDVAKAAAVVTRSSAGEDADEELRVRSADGGWRWIRSRRRPMRDEHGVVVKVAGTTEDVDDRKKSELALRESEERFRQLADNVSVGFTLFAMTDPPQLIYANNAYFRIIGLDPDTPRSTFYAHMAASIHPDDEGVMRRVITEVRAGREVDDEIRIVRPDGKICWTRTRRSPVFDVTGEVIRIAGTTEDVTEQKAAEAALRSARAEADRANAAKNEFLSRMSHELRTPLNAVLGFAQLLSMDDLSDAQADSVGYIVRGGRHLLAMINDVLDIAGIEANRLEMSLEPVLVRPLLAEVIELVRPLASEAGVEIGFDPARVAPGLAVQADLRRLRQVLINLLGNAIKYNHRDGWVDIGCETVDADRVRISVSDSGIGIREADMPRLFTPFDRLGQQTSTIDGAGIGLALSHRLVSFMGGRLEATSVHGQGSVFSVLMSVDEPAVEILTDAVDAIDEASPSTGGSTLLYIEDNHSNVILMQRIVDRRPGWTLVHVDRGIDGLRAAADSDPALIILDLHLPDMSGMDVLLILRDQPQTANTPIVVASADASPGQIARLRQAGADSYVTKPLNVSEVLRFLDTHSRLGNTR